jgi:hypothetical protein
MQRRFLAAAVLKSQLIAEGASGSFRLTGARRRPVKDAPMPRPAWKGYLKISLVNVPVNAYIGSNADEAPVSFHQLHKDSRSRIRYVKTCPIQGELSQATLFRSGRGTPGLTVGPIARFNLKSTRHCFVTKSWRRDGRGQRAIGRS